MKHERKLPSFDYLFILLFKHICGLHPVNLFILVVTQLSLSRLWPVKQYKEVSEYHVNIEFI